MRGEKRSTGIGGDGGGGDVLECQAVVSVIIFFCVCVSAVSERNI